MASVSQVKRLFDLLSKLQSEQSYSAAELAEQMGVSRRTMFRDLKDLEKLGVRASYNDRLQRYVVSLSDETQAAAQITPAELQSLLSLGRGDCENGCENGCGNHDERSPEFLVGRIGLLSGGPQTTAQSTSYSRLARAILRSERVSISLKNEQQLAVCPYRLLLDSGAWYLVAAAPDSSWQGRVAIDDIARVTASGEHFAPLDDGALEELTAAIWSSESHGERAVVTFSREVAETVLEEQQLPGTTLTKFENGKVRLETPMTSLRPMLTWVLSFGSSAVVESPQSLRNAVTTEWQRVAENYHGRREQTPATS